MRDVARDEERLALPHRHVLDLPLLANAHDDVALELEEVLLGVGDVEIVAGVGAADHHHEEVVAVVEVLVADGRLELAAMLVDPFAEIDGGLDRGRGGGHGFLPFVSGGNTVSVRGRDAKRMQTM
jgi:hypothetical protein